VRVNSSREVVDGDVGGCAPDGEMKQAELGKRNGIFSGGRRLPLNKRVSQRSLLCAKTR
jgi:hypothetical protein